MSTPINDPLVSVIVPCYNHQNFIEQCILSIIGQTYKNIEIIVIDDGSKDNSYAILRQLKDRYNFILERQSNQGLSRTLNRGIEKYANGKYISVIASDDYWAADKITKQVMFMEEAPEFAMCCSMAHVVDQKNEVIGVIGDTIVEEDLTLENLLFNNKIPALTALFKKDIYYKVGKFDEDLYFEDWDLWLKIANVAKIGFLKEKLAYYRSHPNNMSKKTLLMVDNSILIINKWHDHPKFKKALRMQHLNKLNVLRQIDKIKAINYWKCHFKDYFMYLRYYKILLKVLIK